MLFTEHIPPLKDSDQLLTSCYLYRQESLHYGCLVQSTIESLRCFFVYKVMSLQQLRLHHIYSLEQITITIHEHIKMNIEGVEYFTELSRESYDVLKAIENSSNETVDLNSMKLRYGLVKNVRASSRREPTHGNPFISQLYRISDAVEVKIAKQVYISNYFKAATVQSSIMSFDRIKIWTGTWNVAGMFPKEGMLDWIPRNEADIYVLGLQEMDLSTEAYMRYDPTLSNSWAALMAKQIGYECICSKQLIGMLIIVFVKNRQYIKELKIESLGSGLMGMIGNKGAVATRFRYKDSYFCFVNCHLAADLLELERRNNDYKYNYIIRNVSKRMVFQVEKEDVDAKGYYDRNPWVCSFYDSKMTLHGEELDDTQKRLQREKMLYQMFSNDTRLLSIFDCDHLIWIGDLNYRVTLPDSETRQLILRVTAGSDTLKGEGYDFSELIQYDQLQTEKNAKRVFNGFEEGRLTFRPTYKYDIGTPLYDSSEKKRVPAWCDRILWKVNDVQNDEKWLQQVYYKSHPDIVFSDHSPVSSLFDAQVRTIRRSNDTSPKTLDPNNEELKTLEEHLSELHRSLDMLENQAREKIELRNDCWFGNVRVGVVYRREVQIKNVGQVIVRMTYGGVMTTQINSPAASIQIKDVAMDPTYSVHPTEVRILPGEKTTLYVYLMIDCVKPLDDILVFFVGNQKRSEEDQKIFVTVTGTVEASLYSASLDSGCKTLHYRSDHAIIKAKTREDGNNDGLLKLLAEMDLAPKRPLGDYSIPIWLFQMLDFLAKYAILDEKGTITGRTEHQQIYLETIKEYVRECLDGGTLDSSIISTISSPVKRNITSQDWKQMLQIIDRNSLQEETILKSMETVSRAIYETLLTFLYKQKLLKADIVYSAAITTPNGLAPPTTLLKANVLKQIQELGSIEARMVVYLFAFLKNIIAGWRPVLPNRSGSTNNHSGTVVATKYPKIVYEVVNALMGHDEPQFVKFPIPPSQHHHSTL
jgi:hypothetical protein